MARRSRGPCDHPCMMPVWIIVFIVWYILLLLYSPVPLAKLLVRLGYRGLCRLQDLLSETRRRLKYGRTNAHNPAAQLPLELQVHVFILLRSRAALGRAERLMESGASDADAVFSGCSDLVAARLVCRAWTDTATAVLYADVTLVTARACVAFARVLLARPQRSLLVRRLVFPPVSVLLAVAPPGPLGWQKMVHGVRKMDLKAAVDRLAVQCTHATDVTFFPPECADVLDEVPGLMQCAQRLEHLAVRRLGQEGSFFAPFPVEQLARLPRLQSLTLQKQRLVSVPATMPATLHTLRLGSCFVTLVALQALLGQLPALRVLFLRDIEVLNNMPLVPVARLVAPAHATLTECTLIGQNRLAVPRSLDFFGALRRFTVSACLLAEAQMLPPLLRELIVTTAPTRFVTRVPSRKALFEVSRCLMRLPTWSAPSLASVQLWDRPSLSQLPYCQVVAYMLREALRPAGIEFAMNLFLDSREQDELHARFQRRYRNRRLLWRDVI